MQTGLKTTIYRVGHRGSLKLLVTKEDLSFFLSAVVRNVNHFYLALINGATWVYHKRHTHIYELYLYRVTISVIQLVSTWALFVTENRPQHEELHALLFTNSVWVLLRSTEL